MIKAEDGAVDTADNGNNSLSSVDRTSQKLDACVKRTTETGRLQTGRKHNRY